MVKSLNRSKFAILGMLNLGLNTGYEIKKFIRESTTNFWSESDGQIYPILKKLHNDGLTERLVLDETYEKHPKKAYQLTEAGKATFNDWLADTNNKLVVRDELLLKCLFGSTVDPEVLAGQLQNTLSVENVRLSNIELNAAKLDKNPNTPEKQKIYLKIVLNREKMAIGAKIRWLEDSLLLLGKSIV